MEDRLEVRRTLPDECPNTVRLAHDNMVDVTTAEVLVRRGRHLEIFAEKHDLQRCVGAMADLDHLESKVLPGRVARNSDERD